VDGGNAGSAHELRNEVEETESRAISYESKQDLGYAVLKLERKRGMWSAQTRSG
jgi:hypothetical protein